MDLVTIRTFCRAIETGNLSKAAAALHITKSVASRRIGALEEDLGVRLLNRTTRGVTPTDEGGLFYERALRILDDLDEARQALQGTDTLTGKLRITAPQSFAELHLREAIGTFIAAHPDLEMEILLSDEKVDLQAGGYDLGLRIARSLDDSALIAKKLATIHNECVASPAYIGQRGAPQTPADLADHQCIYYANVTSSQQWQFMEDGKSKSVRVTGRVTSNSGIMERESALQGVGVCVIPRFFVHEELDSGKLVRLMPDTPPINSTLYILYPERRFASQRVRAFIDHIANWFAEPIHSACL